MTHYALRAYNSIAEHKVLFAVIAVALMATLVAAGAVFETMQADARPSPGKLRCYVDYYGYIRCYPEG